LGKMDEIILVAPRKEVFEDEALTFQGVQSVKKEVHNIIQNMSDSYTTMRRGDAEENEDYKQPIPYGVVKRGNEVFLYKRLSGGGEKRLHDQLSIGVGGHANDVQMDDFHGQMFENLHRELDEELIINTGRQRITFTGLINDDENSVGRVHLGILALVELSQNATVEVRETEQLEGEWVNVKDLKKPEIYDNLESWSQFVADILNK